MPKRHAKQVLSMTHSDRRARSIIDHDVRKNCDDPIEGPSQQL